MLTKDILSIIDYCLLNSCTDMGNARSDIALALLFIGKDHPKIKEKAIRIWEQEQNKVFDSDKWHKKLKMLIFGFLANEGLLRKDYDRINPYVDNIHEIIKCVSIQRDIKKTFLAEILFHFMILPLYGMQIDDDEVHKLLCIGDFLHNKIKEKEIFVSESGTKLIQLYLIVTILNECNEAKCRIVEDIVSLYNLCKLRLNYSMSVLLGINYSFMSYFAFSNIITIREMTDYVLGELLCNKMQFTSYFLSDGFLSEEFLSNVIPMDNRRFSISDGLARILLTYALAVKENKHEAIRKMAIVLLTL